MSAKIEIPTKENRNKRLFLPITASEQKNIRRICKEKKITMSDLVRFALNQVIEM